MGRASKDKRDVYYRRAKEEGWRARSAYKLLQLDDEFGILHNVERVVDLCAAPGSWSQVLSRRLLGPAPSASGAQGGVAGSAAGAASEQPRIVAVDLQPMAPIAGVKCVQGDITDPTTLDAVKDILGAQADAVVCDGAPDVTGLHDFDEYVQAQLVVAALGVCARVLRPGGCFVAKVFRGPESGLLWEQMRVLFHDVHLAKPRASRGSSVEAFVVARDFRPPPSSSSGDSRVNDPLMDALDIEQPRAAPFVACGDLSGWDADRSYDLEVPEQAPTSMDEDGDPSQTPDEMRRPKPVVLAPVQEPTAPAYLAALARRRAKH
ncbi:tRNA (cytidine(32)/guanosine(34)-2'-O)-methyltransferase [Pycnococcus provasolii]